MARTRLTKKLLSLFEADPLAYDPEEYSGNALNYLLLLQTETKEEIKRAPYRVKMSDLGEETASYLVRVRAGRKAAKTREEKAKYKKPRTRKQGEQNKVSDLIDAAAKAKGMTTKQFRKKYKNEVADFETTARLYHNREADLLISDIRFAEKGTGIYVNGKKTTRAKAIYAIARFKNKVVSTGLVYERINIEYSVDANGNIHFKIPTINQLSKFKDGPDEMLDHIEDNYPISMYRK